MAIKFQEGTISGIKELSLMGFENFLCISIKQNISIYFRSLNHPNVIKHIKFIPEIQAIVMEKVDGGNLNEYLIKQTKPIGKSLIE